MELNVEKEVKIPAAEAYGEPRGDLLQKVPRDKLPEGELKVGMMLMVTLPQGQQIPAKIAEVTPEVVMLDLNHPLAGKNLNFKLKVVEISEGGDDCASADCADGKCEGCK